jgi:hypothetical protein
LAIAAASDGLADWAMSAWEDRSLFEARQEAIAAAASWAMESPFRRVAKAFDLAGEFSKSRVGVFAELEGATRFWRGVMMEAAGAGRGPLAVDGAASGAAPPEVPLADAHRALVAVTECMHDLDSNVRPRLALEAMVMQWPTLMSSGT